MRTQALARRPTQGPPEPQLTHTTVTLPSQTPVIGMPRPDAVSGDRARRYRPGTQQLINLADPQPAVGAQGPLDIINQHRNQRAPEPANQYVNRHAPWPQGRSPPVTEWRRHHATHFRSRDSEERVHHKLQCFSETEVRIFIFYNYLVLFY